MFHWLLSNMSTLLICLQKKRFARVTGKYSSYIREMASVTNTRLPVFLQSKHPLAFGNLCLRPFSNVHSSIYQDYESTISAYLSGNMWQDTLRVVRVS